MMHRKIWIICFGLLLVAFADVVAQTPGKVAQQTRILGLMDDLLEQVAPALQTIDPQLKRIALYRLYVDAGQVAPPLRDHFKNQLIELLKSLEQPVVVSLPQFNTLKITSTDSSFAIFNTLPSPEELWQVGRRLRIDAFMEGKLSYLPGNALILDLQLNRTGSNEVLWVHSFTAFEHPPEPRHKNLFKYSLNLATEIFPVTFDTAADSLLRPDFNHRLTHYSIYLGAYQNLWESHRLRYEFRFGISFLADGIKMQDTYFDDPAFYGASSEAPLGIPISYNLSTLLYSGLIENPANPVGDWLSVYLSLSRYFALKMPDLTGVGIGLRTDISSHFSLSAGASLIFGDTFRSVPVKKTGERVNLNIKGIQYHAFFVQYTF